MVNGCARGVLARSAGHPDRVVYCPACPGVLLPDLNCKNGPDSPRTADGGCPGLREGCNTTGVLQSHLALPASPARAACARGSEAEGCSCAHLFRPADRIGWQAGRPFLVLLLGRLWAVRGGPRATSTDRCRRPAAGQGRFSVPPRRWVARGVSSCATSARSGRSTAPRSPRSSCARTSRCCNSPRSTSGGRNGRASTTASR